MEILLTQGRSAIIDDEDWPLIANYSWHAAFDPANGKWYAVATIWNKTKRVHKQIKMHRVITGAGPDEMVDHKEPSQTLDNRRANLRACTNAQNQQNTGSRGGTSQFKGVSWSARKKRWLVQFRLDGRYHYVGYFRDEEDAARAYDAAILPLAGEFARVNFAKTA